MLCKIRFSEYALAALEDSQIVTTPIQWFDLHETHWDMTSPAGTLGDEKGGHLSQRITAKSFT
jgi:hypothetical protein